MRSRQPSRAPFFVSSHQADVSVEISTMDFYGQGRFPIDQARRMDGCSGAHICKLIPHFRAFHTPGLYGCPIHASMNG
jgi:hypothetical protein